MTERRERWANGIDEIQEALYWLERAENAIDKAIQSPEEVMAQAFVGIGHALLAISMMCQTTNQERAHE